MDPEVRLLDAKKLGCDILRIENGGSLLLGSGDLRMADRQQPF
jgi:hypothetical protein